MLYWSFLGIYRTGKENRDFHLGPSLYYKGVKSAYIGMEAKIENYHLGFRVWGMTPIIENHIEHRKQNRQLNGNWGISRGCRGLQRVDVNNPA